MTSFLSRATFLFSLTIVFGLNANVQAQQTDSEVTISTKGHGDWQVRCEQIKGQEKRCLMSQQALVENSRQRLMQVNIAKQAEKKIDMTVVLPLGMYLPAGATLKVGDAAPMSLEIRFCNQSGCYANLDLTSALVAQISKAETVSISIELQPDQQIAVPVSAKGFSDAIASL